MTCSTKISSSGVALFMALMVTTIMFLLASALLVVTMTELQIAGYEERATQAFYLAESAMTYGLSQLRLNHAQCAPMSDTLEYGTSTGQLTVDLYGSDEGVPVTCRKRRATLPPSLYRLVLQGTGIVTGLEAPAKRTIERGVIVKPFALFADQNITFEHGCPVIGNVHANGSVITQVPTETSIQGNLTSALGTTSLVGFIEGQNVLKQDDSNSGGRIEAETQPIPFPEFPLASYYPRYTYQRVEYAAQPLVAQAALIVKNDGVELEEPLQANYYTGAPSDENPLGVFYAQTSQFTNSEIWSLLDVTGTVVLVPDSTAEVVLKGKIKITPPIWHFPALITAHSLHFTFVTNFEAKMDETPIDVARNLLQGIVYAGGDVRISGADTAGDTLTGSLLARNIAIRGFPGSGGTAGFTIRFMREVMPFPAPGLDLVQTGEWREVFEAE